jgi:Zn-dependent alcohol dehydrogenase
MCHASKSWYMEGKINIDDLITHTLPLANINDAFDLMHAGKSPHIFIIIFLYLPRLIHAA